MSESTRRVLRCLAADVEPALGREEVARYLEGWADDENTLAVEAAFLRAAAWLLRNPTHGATRGAALHPEKEEV
jgi:hypothetical protein